MSTRQCEISWIDTCKLIVNFDFDTRIPVRCLEKQSILPGVGCLAYLDRSVCVPAVHNNTHQYLVNGAGCKYQLGSNGALDPDCVKSIAVPLVNCRSSEERDASIFRVGAPVVGTLVGAVVAAVGYEVAPGTDGANVGALLGTFVGANVGETLGAKLGALVG